jgi:outer membrane protein TolC
MALGISFDFGRFKILIGGASAQWWGPMAVAVIFGLTFATLLTLVMVPTMYRLFEKLRGLVSRRTQVASATAAAVLAIGLTLVPGSAEALTLDEAWTAAEDYSIQLQASIEQQVQTGTLRGKALAAVQPQVDVRTTYVMNQREVAFDMTENFPEDILALMGDVDLGDPTVVQEKEFWQAELGVSQRLFSGAALPGYRSARQLNQAAIYDVQDTRMVVKEQVATAFYGLAAAREGLAISQAAMTSAEHGQQLANRQVLAGAAPPRTDTQARLDLARAKRELENARRQLVDAEEGFATLTGLRGITIDTGPARPAPESAEAALQQARIHRPDINASQARVTATEHERVGRDLRFLPVVDGRFAYLYDQNTGFNTEPWNWRATLTASWQLWDGGLRLAERKETASRVRSAELGVRAAQRQAEHDVRVAYEALKMAESAQAAGLEERALAEENLDLAERSFEAGGATWLDVEQAQLQQLSASLAELTARQQRELAAIRLAAASGTL